MLYRVFEVIGIGFTVQSKDFFAAQKPTENAASLDEQFLELLIEQDPHHRFGTSSTIEAAVLAIDQHFDSAFDSWPFIQSDAS